MTSDQNVSKDERERCRYTIEGPRDRSTNKVWWRRPCKRLAEPGTTRCWQHRRPA